MRFSIWPRPSQPWREVLDVARHAERTGWDGVWVADHFMGDGGGFGPETDPYLEATAQLAALAAATERLRLGSLVLSTTYRHPAVLANWAATVDHVSDGRLTLGVGAGWQVNEHQQYGIDLPPVRERVDRFAESLEVLTGLLRADRTTVEGRWFNVTDALCEPKPVQDPLPILIGAKGDRMLGLVARYADAWNLWSTPEQFAERRAELDRRCEAIGRDPATIHTSTQALIALTPDDASAESLMQIVAPRAAVAGTTARIAEAVAGWHEAGVDEVIVPDFVLGGGEQRRDALDQLMAEVVTPFRAGG